MYVCRTTDGLKLGDIEVLHNVMINNKNGEKIYIEPQDFLVVPY